ncbi:MAG: RagB/SusD family nutrient uptake outer membrane protein [Bacteroides nordii]
MQLRKYIISFLFLGGTFGFSGCDGIFRDVPNDKLSQESIWGSQLLLDEYVLPWYRNMSNGFSVYMPSTALLKGACRDYLPWYGDQITVSKSDWYNTAYGDILKSTPAEVTRRGLVNWTNYYTRIQSINLLFENQDKIRNGDHKKRVLGEAHFFRAYYYYMLLRQFGGVLLLKNNYDPLYDGTKFPRASYEEMVNFIAEEADLAASLLSEKLETSDIGRATRGAALMLKAKTYFWAASKIYQNQEKSYLGFPDDRSDAMLTAAAKAYDELMKLPYSLIQITGSTQDQIKEQYRQIFLTKNSQESIWEVQHSDDGDFSNGFGHKLDRESVSPYYGGTVAAYSPTQNHVDEYGMRDGKAYDAKRPYDNRDYRFYANVLYDGCSFRGRVMEIHYNKVSGKEVAGEDLTPYGTSETAAVTKTGYYLGKFVDETQKIDNDESYASKQNYIIWRYAEVLLDYAEIDFLQNRVDDALDKVNQIRRRVHMDELPSLTWDQLVNERRVEMAFEETTYWDLLRWGVAVEKMSGATNPLKAMKIVKEEGKEPVYQISNMNKYPKRVREFRQMQYYLPIPWDEVRYHGIEQNPEWNEV